MKIKKLHIKNFKSLVDLEIVDPNPFTVFVGANGVGKSNIFEALEFHLLTADSDFKLRLFGGAEELQNVNYSSDYSFTINTDLINHTSESTFLYPEELKSSPSRLASFQQEQDFVEKFPDVFSRIFIGKDEYQKINYSDSGKLSLSASNLEKVLKRLLQDSNKREEITEYLQLLIPEFEKIEIRSDNLSGTDALLIYERTSKKAFNTRLISDGTYNLVCLLTAIFQSDEPQFLCIEEPENGLTPYAIEVLVELMRSKCQDNGHYIWLNTHSQTLVRQLKEEELILVSKINGETKVKQLKTGEFYGMHADEAWLTNALGAGLPW